MTPWYPCLDHGGTQHYILHRISDDLGRNIPDSNPKSMHTRDLIVAMMGVRK